MIKKIMCLLLAVVSCFVLSVSAFAAVPTDEASSSTQEQRNMTNRYDPIDMKAKKKLLYKINKYT